MRRLLSFSLTLLLMLPVYGWAAADGSVPLQVRGDHNFPPYEFLDAAGEPAGFNVDIIRAIAELKGLDLQIKLAPWEQVRNDLETGRIDVATGMIFSTERDKRVDFSSPLLTISYAIFVRNGLVINSLQDLQDKAVIVQRDDIMHDYVQANRITDRIISVETQIEALRLLASGQHDVALTAKLQGLYLVHKFKLSNVRTSGPFFNLQAVCFAVKQGDIALQAVLDDGLRLLKASGRFEQIYQRWFGVYEQRTFVDELLWYAVRFLLPLLLLIALAFAWTWALKRQVTIKGRELTAELFERKRAEEELAIEKKFRQFVEAAPIPMGIISRDQQILFLNGKFTQLFGYSMEEVPDLETWRRLVYPDEDYRQRSHDEWNAQAAALLSEQGESRPLERSVVCRDGSLRHVVFRLAFAGEQIFMVANDVTERDRVEQALHFSEARIKGIFNNLAAGIEVLDATERFIDVNDRLAEMLGYSKAELIGRSPLDFTHPEDLETSREFLHRARHGELDTYRREKRYIRKDGSMFWADLAFTQVTDEQGHVMADVGIIFDITERKAIEEKLRLANRELEAFVYTISHDLRTPLTPVIGFPALLKQNYSEQLDATALSLLDDIERAGEKMLSLMEDLLIISRVGYLERPARSVDVNALVNEVVGNLGANVEGGKLDIRQHPLPAIHVPETPLIQLFANLLGNAIRYAGGPIEVSGEHIEGRIRYCVCDHGPGVPVEERSRIFGLFSRGSTGKNLKGTGVGLATVQKVARLYGGRAWVEETPGGGATFCVEMEDLKTG